MDQGQLFLTVAHRGPCEGQPKSSGSRHKLKEAPNGISRCNLWWGQTPLARARAGESEKQSVSAGAMGSWAVSAGTVSRSQLPGFSGNREGHDLKAMVAISVGKAYDSWKWGILVTGWLELSSLLPVETNGSRCAFPIVWELCGAYHHVLLQFPEQILFSRGSNVPL